MGTGLLVKAGDKNTRLERLSEQEVSSPPLCTESGYLNPVKRSLTLKIKAFACDLKPPKTGDPTVLLGRLLQWLICTREKTPIFWSHLHVSDFKCDLCTPFL